VLVVVGVVVVDVLNLFPLNLRMKAKLAAEEVMEKLMILNSASIFQVSKLRVSYNLFYVNAFV
jgi:hypothetical protein